MSEKGKYITLSNGQFFTIRFDKEPEDREIHIYQVYGEDQEVYCMSMRPETLVELIYQLEDLVSGPSE